MRVFETKLSQVLDGVEKVLSTGSSLNVDGKALTQAELVQQLNATLGLYRTVAASRQKWETDLATLRAALPAAQRLYVNLGHTLRQQYGVGNPEVTQFGYAPGGRKVRSSETNVLAAAKAAATRKVRHTLGKNQKLALSKPSGPSLVVYDASGQPVRSVGSASTPVVGGSSSNTTPATK